MSRAGDGGCERMRLLGRSCEPCLGWGLCAHAGVGLGGLAHTSWWGPCEPYGEPYALCVHAAAGWGCLYAHAVEVACEPCPG